MKKYLLGLCLTLASGAFTGASYIAGKYQAQLFDHWEEALGAAVAGTILAGAAWFARSPASEVAEWVLNPKPPTPLDPPKG